MADESNDERKQVPLPPWKMPQLYESGMDFWNKFYPLRIMNSLTRKKDPFVPMNGNRVLWYMCGPTVYDLSHLGHARTYLSFDILRRIMSDYYGYDVMMVMNITDIDDKIIDRANQRGIDFNELARTYEKEFLDDMEALGILPPDCMTRVSEYIDDIIEFVETIVQRGYGYESNGSVYFDTEAFRAAKNHTYGKLVPENVGNEGLLAEGEGHAAGFSSEKKNACDFALWKKSKEGEPTWESPWGLGRPGWHIECSAMSSSTLKKFGGGAIDIHSGGWDLRFPHHENEIAQSEAYFDFGQWVNYFVHSGHLHIEGRKMSKSLKNFITIREALEKTTARQARVFYLTRKYNAPMNYSEAGISGAADLDKQFAEFFLNMKALLRGTPVTNPQRWDDKEKAFAQQIADAKVAVHAALSDDFDTPKAMVVLQNLMKATNIYVDQGAPVGLLVRSVSDYITKMFRIFGLINPVPSIGYQAEGDASGANREEVLAPVVDAFATFRDQVRAAARAGDVSALLNLCDSVRDDVLPGLGVRLEDRSDAPSVWKLVDQAELNAEREAKEAVARAKAEKKAAARAAAAAREAANAVPPEQIFRTLKTDDGRPLYTQFDEAGIPTHDEDGNEITSKGKLKGFKKKWNAQKKKYDKYIAKQGN